MGSFNWTLPLFWYMKPSPHASWHHPQFSLSSAHLGLVQSLSLSLALQGNLLILSADLINDAVQVQIPVVVHGQDDRHVTDVGLNLRKLLQGKWRCSLSLTIVKG